MGQETLAAAMEREHHEIDTGIAEFRAALAAGNLTAEPLTRAMDALRRHIYLEEEFMFPPLRQGGLMAPLFVMVREHGEIWRAMDKLAGQVDGGAGAATLSAACEELVRLLEAHNSKEEPIIYPRADVLLSTDQATQFRELLVQGRTPDGWVCQGART